MTVELGQGTGPLRGVRVVEIAGIGPGPEACHARNPRLVYGRMTGWGQTGPLAHSAGHDLTYIGLTGALDASGQDPDRPHFPTNLLDDFGGGSTYLVIGVLAALLEARTSGRGQVVDAAIVDGTAHAPTVRAAFTARFRERTRDEWSAVFEGTDACVGPVLSLAEAARHPHLVARGTFVEVDGVVQPAPGAAVQA